MQFLKFSRTHYSLVAAVLFSCLRAHAFQAAPAPVFPTVELRVKGEKPTVGGAKSDGGNKPDGSQSDGAKPDAIKPVDASKSEVNAADGSLSNATKPAVDFSRTSSMPATPDAPKNGSPAKSSDDAGWIRFEDRPNLDDKAKDDKEKNGAVPAESEGQGESYVLGPQDAIHVRVVDMDEMGKEPYPIDLRGNLMLPRIGRVHASGKTVEQVEAELTLRYREYLQDPVVSVSVAEFHSQPISILGAIENPGVHQIRGSKSLFEVVSEAGGLRDDAGNTITITRKLENGKLPLANATTDASGKFSVADLNIRSVMSARNPGQNIAVKPYDVITIPKADLIYVIGSVKRPGGFPLQERANMTVLEALALAQGLDRTASGGKAKILRTDENTHSRTEIPIDVKRIMEGKVGDTALLANDILFIPTSTGKVASYRALEALVQTGTGIAIYRP